MYYVGIAFNKRENVQYKTEGGARNAADKKELNVYNAEGELIYEAAPQKTQKRTKNAKTDNLATEDAKQQKRAEYEHINASDEDKQVRTISLPGTVKRICTAKMRIRRTPSWSPDAVCGVSDFDTVEITHLVFVDGKPMYRTMDGIYISADPNLVEYIAE